MPRPSLKPTDEQRQTAKKLAAMGLRQQEIAQFLDIRSVKTLRKHFRRELHRGELEGYVKVQQTRFAMATDGKHPQVTDSWIANYERRRGQQRAGEASCAPPPFFVMPEENAA